MFRLATMFRPLPTKSVRVPRPVRLAAEEAEARLTPAAFDPAAWVSGFTPIPGFAGAVVTTSGNFYPGHAECTAYIPEAGSGGASHLIIYDGGLTGVQLVPSGRYAGSTPIMEPPGIGQVIYSGFVYSPAFTGGCDLTTIRVPGQPDRLVITPGPGGGNQVVVFTPATGAQYSFIAYGDFTFRGGLTVQAGAEYPGGPDVFTVLPMAGGGPRVGIYSADGNPLADFFVGPVGFRQSATASYTLDVTGGPVADPKATGRPLVDSDYVFAVHDPDGSATLWGYDGTDHGDYAPSPDGLGGFGDPPYVG
jgi:hypothetical protein